MMEQFSAVPKMNIRKQRAQGFWWLVLPLALLLLAFVWLRFKQNGDANQTLQKLALGHSTDSITVSPDGKILVIGKDIYPAEVSFWDLKSGRMIRKIDTGHDHGIGLITISPDSKTLATSSVEDDSRLLFWNMETGNKSAELNTAQPLRKSLSYSADGNVLVSAGCNRGRNAIVEAWNPRNGRPLYTVIGSPDDFAFAFPLPDNKTLLTVSGDKIELRDLKTGKLLRIVSKMEKRECIKIALSADGSLLALGTRSVQGASEFIEMWELKTGKRRFQLHENQGAVLVSALKSLVFSPDSKMLVSSTADLASSDTDRARTSADRGIRLRDVESSKLLRTLNPAPYTKSVAFSPDGQTLAASVREEVYLWNVEAMSLN